MASFIRGALLTAIFALIAGCAHHTPKPPAGAQPRNITIYVIDRGRHTALVLPASQNLGRLGAFKRMFPTARWLVFGWGERAFFMAAEPGSGQALRALFPAASVLLVGGRGQPPAANHQVLAVRVSRSGFAGLGSYIWGYVATRPGGAPKRLGPGPRARSAFFASTGTYDLFHTCNTWTAAALHAAGVPIRSGGVVFASQVMRRVRKLPDTDVQKQGTAPTANGPRPVLSRP